MDDFKIEINALYNPGDADLLDFESMYVHYPFPSGSLAITMYETPFQLSMVFKDLGDFSWHSAKYTIGSISKLKIECDSKRDTGASRSTLSSPSGASVDERITSIWHAILRRPAIAMVGSYLIVTIAPGISISLTKEKIKPRLAPVVESPAEYVDNCECDQNEYVIAKCTFTNHLRCMNDISTIKDLESENEQLRAEIVLLHRLTIRDNSLLMRGPTLTRGG